MRNGLVHVFHAAGHRASYRDFLSSRLQLDAVTGHIDAAMARRLIAADRLLFATISPGTALKAVLVALIRSGAGKRTVAICMGEAWWDDKNHPVRTWITQLLYRFLRASGRFKVFTIIPYELFRDRQKMTSDWILDLCLWDLPPETVRNTISQSVLSRRVLEAAGQRAIIVFLGRAAPRKGYSGLVELSRSIGSVALIVSAGPVSKECLSGAEALRNEGMIVENRRITNDELISLYRIADYVWCRYDKASSDMSSGIFGRAVQLERVAVVTKGSYLSRLAAYLGHPVVHDLTVDNIQPRKLPDGELENTKPDFQLSNSVSRKKLNEMAALSLKKILQGL